MVEMKVDDFLMRFDACQDAVDFCARFETLQEAWDACTNPEWLCWWIESVLLANRQDGLLEVWIKAGELCKEAISLAFEDYVRVYGNAREKSKYIKKFRKALNSFKPGEASFDFKTSEWILKEYRDEDLALQLSALGDLSGDLEDALPESILSVFYIVDKSINSSKDAVDLIRKHFPKAPGIERVLQ